MWLSVALNQPQHLIKLHVEIIDNRPEREGEQWRRLAT